MAKVEQVEINDITINRDKLKEIVKSSGNNISGFALEIDIEPSTMSRLLAGTKSSCNLITLLKIANYAGVVDVRELIIIK
jgi:hypothetical protein